MLVYLVWFAVVCLRSLRVCCYYLSLHRLLGGVSYLFVGFAGLLVAVLWVVLGALVAALFGAVFWFLGVQLMLLCCCSDLLNSVDYLIL